MLPKHSHLIITLTVIFIGVVLLLGNLGIIPRNIVALWPIILVLAGLVGLSCMDTKDISSKSKSKKRR